MQQVNNDYAVVIMSEGRNTQLYPLTKNYPLALLPVGNKKIILYQLQAIQSVPNISRVYILISSTDTQLKKYFEKQFITTYPNYPYKLILIQVNENQPSYTSLQQALPQISRHIGYIILPIDTISSISISKVLQLHKTRNSDCTLLLKLKKQSQEGDKKIAQNENETEIDYALIGEDQSLLMIDMMEQYDYNGLKISSSVYRRAKKISVKKVIDSRIYILSPNIIKICQSLISSQLVQLKQDFISTIVNNQTNQNLLKYISSQFNRPINAFCLLTDADEYIRRVSTIKAYEIINLDSLIRGGKVKSILLPTKYTYPSHPKFDTTKTGLIIGNQTTIQEGYKIRRSVIEDHCQIGKNVQIINSIIMRGCKINDNCKISESIIGCDVQIGQGSTIKGCQAASKSRIADGSKRQNQIIIPI